MKRRDLLRRSSEALAAMVIVISIVVYSFAVISGINGPAEPGQVVSAAGGEGLHAEANLSQTDPDRKISQSTYQNGIKQANETGTIAGNNASVKQDDAAVANTAVGQGEGAPVGSQVANTAAVQGIAPAESQAASVGQVEGASVAAQAINTSDNSASSPTENEGNKNAPVTGNTPESSNIITAAVRAAEAGEKAANEKKALEPVYKYVQIDTLNIRSGPSTETEKLGELEKGSRVQVLQNDDKWLEVLTSDNLKGYVYAEYTGDTLPPVYKYVSVDKVNLRKGAGSDTEKLGTLYQGARVQVIEVLDKWMNIITADNQKAYAYTEYFSDKAPVIYKYINSEKLNLRKGPDTETKKLATLQAGDKVQFLETKGEWARIKTSDNVEGYIKSKYVVNSSKQVSRAAESTPQPHNADLASKVLEYAQKFVGVKYVYGGESPKGFDCSGFTQYVFEHFDIKVPRSAAEYGSVGTKVSRSDIKPGDLVLLDRYWNNELGHVGIYMGNDKFIHASSKKGKVVIAKLSEYSGTLLGIRRVLK